MGNRHVFRRKSWLAAICAGLLLLPGLHEAVAATERNAWRFKVFYDGKDIGEQRFRISRSGEKEQVDIEAAFKVSFLGIDVYRYEHQNREVWSSGCLESMQARTDDGGERLAVDAAKTPAGLKALSQGREALLPGCVMSFAYWNPEFLKQQRLLNSQTGEYQPVSIRAVGSEAVKIGQRQLNAVRYKLKGKEIDMDLWYADNREWVRLESDLKGSRLVYELAD